MGKLVYLFKPEKTPSCGIVKCPNYRPADQIKESWIYYATPEMCGTCIFYEPSKAGCIKLPYLKECICYKCGRFSLSQPGTTCPLCDDILVAITSPVDW